MSPLTVVFFACLAVCATATPSARAVANPKTPNQILDAVIERAAANIKSMGWDVSKNVQNSYSNIGLDVDDSDSALEKFEITSAQIFGFDTLRRSKSATFEDGQSTLKGTVRFTNASIEAQYTATFAGAGAADSLDRTGEVKERLATIFADIEIELLDLVPQRILSYSVRNGADFLDNITNMEGTDMAYINFNAFRQALSEAVDKTVRTNIKVQINKAIQAWKAEA